MYETTASSAYYYEKIKKYGLIISRPIIGMTYIAIFR